MSAEQDRTAKIRQLLSQLAASEGGLAILRDTLLEAGHKLIPRVEFMSLPEVTDPDRLAAARSGVILDVETTGLVPTEDKVIQLSMLKIRYDEQGILSIGEMFDAYRDPGMPIPAEITGITGITDEMVAGKTIRDEDLSAFLEGVDMAIAHNAGFDRKFAEANFPMAGFQEIDWHCSLEQVDWKARGEKGASLELLSLRAGFVYDAHNSRSDILATAFVLASDRHDEKPSPFVEMLQDAALAPRHLFAKDTPFHAKDLLKEHGYRWAGADDPVCGHGKVWHRILPGDSGTLAAEAEFLKSIYGRDKVLPFYGYTARNRYSIRPPERLQDFCTKSNVDAMARLQLDEDQPSDLFSQIDLSSPKP